MLRCEGYKNFVVYAETAGGISTNPVFGTTLDGMLAGIVRHLSVYEKWMSETGGFFNNFRADVFSETCCGFYTRHKDGLSLSSYTRPSVIDGGLSLEHPSVTPLPLGVCVPTFEHGNIEPGGLWHWTCSTSHLFDEDLNPITGEQLSESIYYNFYTNTFKEVEGLQTSIAVPKNVGGSRGRFKNKRIPVMVSNVKYVAWSAYGDPDIVYELLHCVSNVGDQNGRGEGEVLRWGIDFGELFSVQDDIFHHTHLSPTPADVQQSEKSKLSVGACRNLSRPLPELCVSKMNQHGGTFHVNGPFETVEGGLRPPVFHPSTKTELLHTPVF